MCNVETEPYVYTVLQKANPVRERGGIVALVNKVDEKIYSLMRSEADDRVHGGATRAWDYAGRRLL